MKRDNEVKKTYKLFLNKEDKIKFDHVINAANLIKDTAIKGCKELYPEYLNKKDTTGLNNVHLIEIDKYIRNNCDIRFTSRLSETMYIRCIKESINCYTKNYRPSVNQVEISGIDFTLNEETKKLNIKGTNINVDLSDSLYGKPKTIFVYKKNGKYAVVTSCDKSKRLDNKNKKTKRKPRKKSVNVKKDRMKICLFNSKTDEDEITITTCNKSLEGLKNILDNVIHDGLYAALLMPNGNAFSISNNINEPCVGRTVADKYKGNPYVIVLSKEEKEDLTFNKNKTIDIEAITMNDLGYNINDLIEDGVFAKNKKGNLYVKEKDESLEIISDMLKDSIEMSFENGSDDNSEKHEEVKITNSSPTSKPKR